MLFSASAFATMLVVASASGLSDVLSEMPVNSGSAPVTPQDPSSLVLALIGAGTMAFYLAANWRPSRTEELRPASRWRDGLEQVETPAAEQRRSRGAA